MLERDILDASVTALAEFVATLTPTELRARAFPSEWTVADVLSHIGSGAETLTNAIESALGAPEVEPRPIWEAWNAKEPEAKAADCLPADRAFVDRLDALSDAQRANFAYTLGPLDLDLAAFIRLRINEHTLHRWDIEVVRDPQAALPSAAVPLVLEAVPMIASWAARAPALGGARVEYAVQTSAPDARFTITIAPGEVRVARADSAGAGDKADIELPAEALIRLVYGRLDIAHTPPYGGDGAVLDELCAVFPGL